MTVARSVRSLFDLSGKVAMITGGSRGLGLSVAQAVGELGAKVALVARNQEDLDAAAGRLAAQGIEAKAFAADLGQPAEVAPLVDNVLAAFGRIDILVNNAAAAWAQSAQEHSLEGWRKVMALNVDAIFLLTQEVGRREMIPREAGTIVNVASIGGLRGNRPEFEAFTLAYSTSKGAIVNFTRALATEWGRYGITVNALCPGFFRSKLSGGLIDRNEDGLIEATPLGRLADEDDLKGAAAFLCSAASRHMTGQTLVVDGGMTAC